MEDGFLRKALEFLQKAPERGTESAYREAVESRAGRTEEIVGHRPEAARRGKVATHQ